jgi:serine/threonine protein kinase
MAFTSGTKLGPYKILAPLGAGGMREVYQARDTRLDRTIASKILPSHLCDDPTRRECFEREAYTAYYQVSSLFVSEGK